MSRGFGHVQRFVLSELDEQCALDDRWLPAQTIATRFEGSAPADASVRTVRRALRLLAAEGLVELASSGSEAVDLVDRRSLLPPRGRLIARVPPALRGDATTRRAARRRSAAQRVRTAPPSSGSTGPARSFTLTLTGAAAAPDPSVAVVS
jgi:hypothetical protein